MAIKVFCFALISDLYFPFTVQNSKSILELKRLFSISFFSHHTWNIYINAKGELPHTADFCGDYCINELVIT